MGNKENVPNKKAGADARSLASAPLLGSDITDKERETLRDNPLTAVADLLEAITAGIVTVEAPKETFAAGVEEASSSLSSTPLSPKKKTVPQLMAEEKDNPKKIVRPPSTWEVPTTRRQSRNRRHPFYLSN